MRQREADLAGVAGDYLSDVESFATPGEVTWRESMAGSSFVVGLAAVACVVGLLVWWRRRA